MPLNAQARQYPIPADVRGAVWFRITGGEEYMHRLPGRFAQVLHQGYGEFYSLYDKIQTDYTSRVMPLR